MEVWAAPEASGLAPPSLPRVASRLFVTTCRPLALNFYFSLLRNKIQLDSGRHREAPRSLQRPEVPAPSNAEGISRALVWRSFGFPTIRSTKLVCRVRAKHLIAPLWNSNPRWRAAQVSMISDFFPLSMNWVVGCYAASRGEKPLVH